jgi:FkbM family methyltransferase
MNITTKINSAIRFSVKSFISIFLASLPDRLMVYLHQNTSLIRPLDFDREPRIDMYVESNVELNVRIYSVSKEPEMLTWFEKYLKKDDVFYDVGANVGAYSLLAAALYRGEVDIISFEPSATNFAQLTRNIGLNKWANRITPLPIALTDSRRLLHFGYSDLIAGAALHVVRTEPFVSEKAALIQKVVGMPLDDLITSFGIPSPSVMKIDVDGAELGVLKGAANTLGNPRLKSVLIELEDESEETKQVEKLFNI